MADSKSELSNLYRTLGLKTLNPVWAKIEIVLGLTAVGAAQLLTSLSAAPAGNSSLYALPALLLFVLGGYLALAGHRSHLYQSYSALTAYILSELRQSQTKG
jgi:hypothetical protein